MARGSVRRRGSSWHYVVDVGIDPATGRRRQRFKRGFRTRKAAEAALREVVVEIGTGTHAQRSTVATGEYLTEWLETVRSRLRPTTWSSYEMAVRRLRQEIGAAPLQALTPLQVERLYSTLSTSGGRMGRPLSAKSVLNTHVVLRKALADAERLGLVARNAAAAARPPRHERTEQRTWSPAEVRHFLECATRDRLYTLFLLLVTTGMRRGEALGLRWADVDFDRSRAAIVQTVTTVNNRPTVSSPKTSKSRRSVALDPDTVAALRAHRRAQAAERLAAGELWDSSANLAFTDELGRVVHPDRASAAFRRLVKESQLPAIRLHDLRHTHATLALRAGVHPKVVSERLGHATVGITLDLYSHVAPVLDADAAALVARSIFGPVGEPG